MTEYAKKLLRLYHEQSKKNRIIEGSLPLNFKGKGKDLKNYRIYGNTVNGESVGDRTGNLFDGSFIHRSVVGNTVGGDNPNRRAIVVDISNFNNGDKITFSRETGVGNIFQMYQITSPLEGGSLLNDNVFSGNSETLLATITLDDISNYPYLMIFLNGALKPIVDETLLASKIMVNVGDTSLPYEPYGYKVPVTVTNGTDTQTTNLYLPEQIKMVGDEAEYIDFGEQKQHFADGTSTDVLLPALPTISGTNTLSVGTEVQPSKVEIKGKIKAVQEGSGENEGE